MEFKNRKNLRLKHFDYNSPGAYFITICVKNREELLSSIIPSGNMIDAPENKLTEYGLVVDEILSSMTASFNGVVVKNYVIMPNHVHFLVEICEQEVLNNEKDRECSYTHNKISMLVSAFKRLVGKKIGCNIWQRSSFDHVVRDEKDYNNIWEYINSNVFVWEVDKLNKKIFKLR